MTISPATLIQPTIWETSTAEAQVGDVIRKPYCPIARVVGKEILKDGRTCLIVDFPGCRDRHTEEWVLSAVEVVTVAAPAAIKEDNEPLNCGDNGRGRVQAKDRQRNTYPGNCSECKRYVEANEGYLFKNTKYSTSKGYHVKCKNCLTGATCKRLKEEEKKSKTKTLSINFAKKWLQGLQMKHQSIAYLDGRKNPIACEVYSEGSLILGWCDFSRGCQEYPTEEWCQEQATKLGGHFTDSAVSYICEELTERIQVRIGQGEILRIIEQDSHPLKLIPLEKVVLINSVEHKHIEKALIQLRISHKIELRATKTGVARSLGIDLVGVSGINYGFLKYE